MLLYPATVKRDGDTFVILFPDIPFAHTNGSTRADALANAPLALQTALSMLIGKDMDIPLPSEPRSKTAVLVGLPSVVGSAKIELYTALRSSRVRKAELARRMGIHKQQV